VLETALFALLGSGALLSWFYALYHWVSALGHRKPHISLSTLFFHGILAFDGANFTEAGQAHVRGLKRGFVAFFVFVLAGMGAGAALVALRG